MSTDVRVRSQVESTIAETVDRLGGLDVLVTVVGGQVAFVPAVKLHQMSDEDWDTVYEVNLRYVSRVVRSALSVFLNQGTGGAIISIGSVEEIAVAAAYLASDASAYVTGQQIVIDGGVSVRGPSTALDRQSVRSDERRHPARFA